MVGSEFYPVPSLRAVNETGLAGGFRDMMAKRKRPKRKCLICDKDLDAFAAKNAKVHPGECRVKYNRKSYLRRKQRAVIVTPFPTARETAKKLGVPMKQVREIEKIVEQLDKKGNHK